MTALMWLTVSQVTTCFDVKRSTVENWIKRDRVEHKLEHGLRWIDGESVERYLRDRGTNGLRRPA